MAIINAVASWLHLLAAVIWIGGMFYALLAVVPSLTAIDSPPSRGKFMGAILARFAPIAWAAIAVLVLTGIVIMVSRIPSPAVLVGTTYGIALLAKLVVAAAMIAIAVVVGFVLSPRMAAMVSRPPVAGGQSPAAGPPAGPPPQVARLQSQVMILGKTNLVLGMLMLVAVAVMRWL